MAPIISTFIFTLLFLFIASAPHCSANKVGGNDLGRKVGPADIKPNGESGSAHGPNWNYSWGWGSTPTSGWGYGSGSGSSPSGYGKGSGFGFGSGSGSGSGYGYGYGSGGAHGGGHGSGSGARGGSVGYGDYSTPAAGSQKHG